MAVIDVSRTSAVTPYIM